MPDTKPDIEEGTKRNLLKQEIFQPDEACKRFVGIVNLEPTRLYRDIALITEVISHLNALPNAKLDITLEIKAGS